MVFSIYYSLLPYLKKKFTANPIEVVPGTHDMKKETAHWGTGINTVSQASEIHTSLAQLFYQRNKMPHTAPQPVQLPRRDCRSMAASSGVRK